MRRKNCECFAPTTEQFTFRRVVDQYWSPIAKGLIHRYPQPRWTCIAMGWYTQVDVLWTWFTEEEL